LWLTLVQELAFIEVSANKIVPLNEDSKAIDNTLKHYILYLMISLTYTLNWYIDHELI